MVIVSVKIGDDLELNFDCAIVFLEINGRVVQLGARRPEDCSDEEWESFIDRVNNQSVEKEESIIPDKISSLKISLEKTEVMEF